MGDLLAKQVGEAYEKCRTSGTFFFYGTASAEKIVKSVATESPSAVSVNGKECTQPRIIPLYVMTYIFDLDDLSADQMKETAHETAQYSIHVLALVMCPATKVAIICDANGSLMLGGNMEHITVPLRGRKPTVYESQYDLDNKKVATKATTTKVATKSRKKKVATTKVRGKKRKL